MRVKGVRRNSFIRMNEKKCKSRWIYISIIDCCTKDEEVVISDGPRDALASVID